MRPTVYKTNFKYAAATHKPRISLCIDGDERYYRCTDGGLTQYGDTQQQAFDNLSKLR